MINFNAFQIKRLIGDLSQPDTYAFPAPANEYGFFLRSQGRWRVFNLIQMEYNGNVIAGGFARCWLEFAPVSLATAINIAKMATDNANTFPVLGGGPVFEGTNVFTPGDGVVVVPPLWRLVFEWDCKNNPLPAQQVAAQGTYFECDDFATEVLPLIV